jgi:bacteriocin-like protein
VKYIKLKKMKKLNKLVLQNAKTMTANQMKHITGGYSSCSGGVWCYLSWDNPNNGGTTSTDGCCGQSDSSYCQVVLEDMYRSMFSGFSADCYYL